MLKKCSIKIKVNGLYVQQIITFRIKDYKVRNEK